MHRKQIVLFCILFWGACDHPPRHRTEFQPKSLIQSTTQNTVSVRLPSDEVVVLPKKPKRTIILLTSLVNLWEEAGGSVVGRCAGSAYVAEEARKAPVVGTFSMPNVEKIIGLEPDLVIGADVSNFRALIPILNHNRIAYAFFDYVNYYDYQRLFELFSLLNGTFQAFETSMGRMNGEINQIVTRCREFKSPKVLVIFSTSHSVSCELPNSQTSVMLSMLGARNVISDKYRIKNKTRVDFNLEHIVQLDPDIILLNTMGDVAACEKRLTKEFATNAAWSALRAIRNQRFHVLPKKYFLYKPNKLFPEALKYLAAILYPQPEQALPMPKGARTWKSS